MEINAEIETVLQAMPAGVCLVGSDDKIHWVNALMADMIGEAESELVGRELDDLPISKSEGGAPEALFSPRGRPGMRLRVVTRELDTSTRLVLVSDVTGLAKAGSGLDLHELSRTDLDTGLLTPKAIFQQLVSEVSRCRRYGNRLSVILVQVPGANDDAISKVAVRLADNLRWVDFAGRLESDSFLLVLPETELESAEQGCKRRRDGAGGSHARVNRNHRLTLATLRVKLRGRRSRIRGRRDHLELT